jgi:hypothetical protein
MITKSGARQDARVGTAPHAVTSHACHFASADAAKKPQTDTRRPYESCQFAHEIEMRASVRRKAT